MAAGRGTSTGISGVCRAAERPAATDGAPGSALPPPASPDDATAPPPPAPAAARLTQVVKLHCWRGNLLACPHHVCDASQVCLSWGGRLDRWHFLAAGRGAAAGAGCGGGKRETGVRDGGAGGAVCNGGCSFQQRRQPQVQPACMVWLCRSVPLLPERPCMNRVC